MEGVGDTSALEPANSNRTGVGFPFNEEPPVPPPGEVLPAGEWEHPVCRHCGGAIAYHPMGWIHQGTGRVNCHASSPMAEPAE